MIPNILMKIMVVQPKEKSQKICLNLLMANYSQKYDYEYLGEDNDGTFQQKSQKIWLNILMDEHLQEYDF